MKNLIVSVLFILVSVFGFSQNKYDSTLINIKISTTKITKNKKEIKYDVIYVFDVYNNWIYFTKKDPKYSMTITDIELTDGNYYITAVTNTKKKTLYSFIVPLNNNSNFVVHENGNEYITVNYDIKKRYLTD
jgi:hypothetical protein